MKKKFLSGENEFIQSFSEYDPFKNIREELQEIKKDVRETKIMSKKIYKNQNKLLEIIQKQPDFISLRLKELLTDYKLDNAEKLKINKLLDKYLKITETVQKTEYWMKNLKILMELIPFLHNVFSNL